MRRIVALELMDQPGVDVGEFRANFDDIEFANRRFGGSLPVTCEVLSHVTPPETFGVLDVGCGSADIARDLVRAATGFVTVVGLDSNADILAIARERTPLALPISFVHADGGALPFDDASFDIAMCNLALHHFEPPAAVAMLRELRRVSRVTPLVCDLVRSRIAFLGAWLFARILAKNRLTKHDGPLSVRRAYTPDEALALARDAGWHAPRVTREPFFRMVLTDGV